MRLQYLLIAITLGAPAVFPPAASARDWTVNAVDWQFVPVKTTIVVGDSITWRFTAAGHTSTSVAGQAESWNSAPTGTNPVGSTYSHVFTKPGQYEYICIPHEDFMRGVVEVRPGGEPAPVVSSLATKRRGRSVRLRFHLNRSASVTYRLNGPSRRTVKRSRLGRGEHSLRLRRLRRGRYRGVLTATDMSGQKTRRANSFRIR